MKIKENSEIHKSLGTHSLKTAILILLCLQNACYTLVRKYSTANENVSSKEILLVGEIIKIAFSVYVLLTYHEVSDSQGEGLAKLLWLIKHSGKMFTLAGIYGAMNILSFVALQYIGAGEFTICAQLKILTTAGFAVVVLGRSLSEVKWRALAQLVLGCILVASPSFSSKHGDTSAYMQVFGYAAVLTEVVLSGFASIYFEKVVKSTTELVTIWERNFQLGIYSVIMYGGIIIYEQYFSGGSNSRALFANWTWITLTVSILGAAGGLLVAATLKYADAILKTLAAAGAIVISTAAGHYLLGGPLDLVIGTGACVVILSIANYTFDPTPK